MADHDAGLHHDLETLAQMTARRRVLLWIAGAALAPPYGCGNDSTATARDGGTTCGKIPEETAGPYPGDGSNGPNALTATGVVRSDIRSSFGT